MELNNISKIDLSSRTVEEIPFRIFQVQLEVQLENPLLREVVKMVSEELQDAFWIWSLDVFLLEGFWSSARQQLDNTLNSENEVKYITIFLVE